MKIALRLALLAVACAVLYGAYTAYETLTGDFLATGSGSSVGDAGATAPGAAPPLAAAPTAAPMAAAPGPSAPATASPGGYAPPPSGAAAVPETSRGIAEDPGAPPKIQSVSPPAGSAQGGERVVIKGESFARPQVLFGNSPAQVVEATPDALTVVVPAPERAGAVALVVTNRSGGYAVRPNAYTYASR